MNGEKLDYARLRMQDEQDCPPVIWCDDHGFVYPTEQGFCSHCAAFYSGFDDDPDLLADPELLEAIQQYEGKDWPPNA